MPRRFLDKLLLSISYFVVTFLCCFRWDKYSKIGNVIHGTRFIAFKAPLDQGLAKKQPPDRAFVANDLLTHLNDHGHNLGLVIDLTNNSKKRYPYYDPEELTKDVDYKNIRTKGHGKVPSFDVQQEFANKVKSFLDGNQDNNHLIGVHCTHGVNRTGYLICRYMISVMEIQPDKAIKAFYEARGHGIERENYLEDLKYRRNNLPSPRTQPRPDNSGHHASWPQGPATQASSRDNWRSDRRNDWRDSGHQSQRPRREWSQQPQYQGHDNYLQGHQSYTHHNSGYGQPRGRRDFHQGHHSNLDNRLGHGNHFDTRTVSTSFEERPKLLNDVRHMSNGRLRLDRTQDEQALFVKTKNLVFKMNKDAKDATLNESYSHRNDGSVWKYCEQENGRWVRDRKWRLTEEADKSAKAADESAKAADESAKEADKSAKEAAESAKETD